ncbi:hypothetical protein HR060_11500 [Catenovulum sp. SM1970]|uniref:hypothetical protein n=1 Tax=Marinifaba aquimaris TaxID=2741323 RepID=UPI001572C46A|nr:hypothetical protein [Marinifaba aquimaris]NTS77487.1 hypothetical protein [Marinifaba aquimaris]
MYQFTKIIILVCALTFNIKVGANTFKGFANHSKQAVAKEQSLSALQQTLYVNIESESYSYQDNKGNDFFKVSSQLSSSIPLVGAITDCVELSNEYQCQSKLNSSQSMPLYQALFEQEQKLAMQNWQQIQLLNNADVKYEALNELFKKVHLLQQVAMVIALLNPKLDTPNLEINITQIIEQMVLMEEQVTSLDMASKLLVRKLSAPKQRVLVKPITHVNSSEITPFTKLMQTHLQNELNAVRDIKNAELILTGQYSELKELLNLQVSLTDLQGSIISTAVIAIQKSALVNYEYRPKQPTFDTLLYSQQLINNEFSVELQTNKGSRNLLFDKGETLNLMLKVSQPAYYYIVGHTKTGEDRMSYLMDLQDAKDDYRFIKYISPKEANHWINIAEFEVAEPFGQEILQVFASTINPIEIIPTTNFDGFYHKIDGKIEENIQKVRGFKRIKDKAKASLPKVAEAVLSITTSG